MTRSNRAEVRNPILKLNYFQRITMHPEARQVLEELMVAIADDARLRAEQCWRKHKAPMAAYWKAVSVYAGHIRKAIKAMP